MTTERWIVVLGAGGTGLYMAEVIERTDGCRCGGFLDDDPSKRPEDCCGYPGLGRLGDWASLPEEYAFVTSLYGPKSNPRLAQVVESLQIPDGRWASVVEGQAWVSRHASIGIGCFVGPGSVIEPMATLGPRCALLGNVYIAHHVRLAEYVVCANSASVAGGVSIGRATYIGANATIREYLAVGGGALVGMGAVVCSNVPDGHIVVGNPARPFWPDPNPR